MKVAAYCRYSSEMQREGYSIEAQLRAIEEFCCKESHELVAKYIDEACSGTNDIRNEFQKMIKDSSNGGFKAVIVHKLDRFARDRYDSAIYRKKLTDNDVRLISVLEPLDGSPESIMMESVLEGMAEYYSKNLSREVLKGKNESARKGFWNGGRSPFAIKINADKTFSIIPEEATIVKTFFNLREKGYTYSAIADESKKMGFLNRNGNFFKPDYINDIINNPIYKGALVFGKTTRKKEDLIIVNDAVEPIISKEQFENVQRICSSRKTIIINPRMKNRKEYYILTGYLKCGHCGATLHGTSCQATYMSSKTGKRVRKAYYSYRCSSTDHKSRKKEYYSLTEECISKSINKEKIEKLVFDSINEKIFNDENCEKLIGYIKTRLSQRNVSAPKNVELLKNKISKLNMQKNRLLDLYLDCTINKEQYNQKDAELTQMINVTTNALNEIVVFDFKDINVDLLRKYMNAFKQSSQINSSEYRKKLLQTFIEYIEVNNDHITINYKVNLPIGSTFSFENFQRQEALVSTIPSHKTTGIKSVSYSPVSALLKGLITANVIVATFLPSLVVFTLISSVVLPTKITLLIILSPPLYLYHRCIQY